MSYFCLLWLHCLIDDPVFSLLFRQKWFYLVIKIGKYLIRSVGCGVALWDEVSSSNRVGLYLSDHSGAEDAASIPI